MILRITVALWRIRFPEHRVKRRDDRHVEAGEKLDDVAAGLTAEDSVFVLQADRVDTLGVEECRGATIVVDILLADLEPNARRIVIIAPGVGHRDDRGLEVGTSRRDRLMQIVGEGGDSAAARKLVADEGDPARWVHAVVSERSWRCRGSNKEEPSDRNAEPRVFI